MSHDRRTPRIFSNLLLAALLAGGAACAGSGSPPAFFSNSLRPVATPAAALAPSPAFAAPAVDRVDPEVSAKAAEAVGKALPRLRGVPPGRQLQTLRWMLSVGDDRRLVALFDDLSGNLGEPL